MKKMTELNNSTKKSRRVVHIRHWMKHLALGCLCLLSGWLCVLPAYSGSDIYFVINDHLGTPQMLIDMDQKVVWEVKSQTPFGEVEVDEDPDGDGQKVEFNVRAPGQYYDKETGLHYNHHRYYDPKTGRYITADPRGITLDYSDPQRQVAAQLGIPIYPSRTGSINHLYHYANQNPLRYTDPTGELAIPLIFPVVAGLGAAGGCIATNCGQAVVDAVDNMMDALSEWVPPWDDVGPDPIDQPGECENDLDPNKKDCQALKNSILKTCAGLTGKKQFNCWAAANKAYRQCMGFE